MPIVDGFLELATLKAMSGRRITIAEVNQKTDLIRALSHGAGKVTASLNKLVAVLDQVDREYHTGYQRGAKHVSYDLIPLLEAFETCTYRLSEFYETLGDDVIRRIPSLAHKKHRKACAEFRQIISAKRRTWTLICNKMKHNQHILTGRTVQWAALCPVVIGYSLMAPKGRDGIIVSNELHKPPERARSFNISMRQLIADFLKSDQAAASLIAAIDDECDADDLPQNSARLDIIPALNIISRRGVWSLPKEKTMFDGFRMTEDAVILERQQAHVVSASYTSRFYLKVDAPTRSIEALSL